MLGIKETLVIWILKKIFKKISGDAREITEKYLNILEDKVKETECWWDDELVKILKKALDIN